jgi:hypothetical protein
MLRNVVAALLEARRESTALRLGSFAWLPTPDGVLAWERCHGTDRRVVIVNFTDEPRTAPLGPGLEVEVASDGHDPDTAFDGHLGPDRALVLRPSART